MSQVDVQSILNQVEQLLAIAGELPEQAEQAVEKLLNVVEELCADRQTLAKEVERLRQQLDKKKKAKTTSDNDPQGDKQDDSNHSSEERRKPDRKVRPLRDRRSRHRNQASQHSLRETRLPFGEAEQILSRSVAQWL